MASLSGKGGSKEVSKGRMTPVTGGGKGHVGKQGGAAPARSGKVFIPGNAKGGGKWGKGGGKGFVGTQGTTNRANPGKVSVPRGR